MNMWKTRNIKWFSQQMILKDMKITVDFIEVLLFLLEQIQKKIVLNDIILDQGK